MKSPLCFEPLGRAASWRAAWALALVFVFAGCTAVQPPLSKPPAAYAPAPKPDSLFAALERRIAAGYGKSTSGFRLLRRNEDALTWRLGPIDSAKHSLDLQYYVWFGDKAGQLMMARAIAGANRGVRVRLLFDDLNTLLHDMTSVELRDAALAKIDRHPNISKCACSMPGDIAILPAARPRLPRSSSA